jgi:hypothetical protein
MKLLFDDDQANSNPNIDSKHNIIFVKINGEKGMGTVNIRNYTQGIIKLKKTKNLKVYFDWDLTLSRQASIDITEYYKNRSKDKYKKNLIKYLGSDIRRQALRDLFKTIRKKNGKIYILTRNPTAYLKKEQIFFPEIINSLEGTRTFTLKELHYCPPSISKSAYIKKVN